MTDEFENVRPAKPKAKSDIYFKTGSTLLDLLIAGGTGMGTPAGKIINVYGESGAGKTFVACEMIAAAKRQYKDKFKFQYDDAEHGFSFDGMKMWGVDINPMESTTVEELFYNVRKFLRELKEDECGIYVVDSLDALTNDENNERAEERMKAGDKGEVFDKGNYGMSAQKFLSQEFFRKIAGELADHNCNLIFVSQLRDNVNAGLYGEKRRKSGGSALDFYCDTILELRNKEKFEKQGLVTGVCVEARLKKSKTARPFRSALINIIFDYGIDDISSNIDYVFDLKSDQTGKLGSKLTCNMGDSSDPRYGKYEYTFDGVKSVLADEGLLDAIKATIKEAGEKFNRATVEDAFQEAYPDVFTAYFGAPYEREELILLADKDKSVRTMLKSKAISKWEDKEASVASGRTKYSDEEDD